MTIHDYIKKHNLELWRRVDWPTQNTNAAWLPSVLVDSPNSGHRVTFEIYSDKDCIHFVTLNITDGQFRIVRREIVEIASPWSPIGVSYEVQPFH